MALVIFSSSYYIHGGRESMLLLYLSLHLFWKLFFAVNFELNFEVVKKKLY